MDDFAPFESPKVLLKATKESIVDFKRAASAFFETCTHTVVSRIDNKVAEQVYSYRFSQRIPPRLRVEASSILVNIKHALDQCVCDAALMTGRPNAKGIHFPIGRTREDFNGEIVRRLRNCASDLIEFIRALEIHESGNTALYRFLSLAGTAKHTRLLRLGLTGTGNIMHVDESFYIPGPSSLGCLGWNEARNEMDFLRVPRNASTKFNISPVLELFLYPGEPPFDKPASALFDDMSSETERIILALEAEATRIARHA